MSLASEKLQTFDLHSNPVTALDPTEFGLFSHLSHIDLSQTGFKNLYDLLASLSSTVTGIVISLRSNGIVDVKDVLTGGYNSYYQWQSLARTV